jgi:acyl carrier protein
MTVVIEQIIKIARAIYLKRRRRNKNLKPNLQKDTNFFVDLGFSNLEIDALISAIEEALNIDIDISSGYQDLTVGNIAELVTSHNG